MRARCEYSLRTAASRGQGVLWPFRICLTRHLSYAGVWMGRVRHRPRRRTSSGVNDRLVSCSPMSSVMRLRWTQSRHECKGRIGCAPSRRGCPQSEQHSPISPEFGRLRSPCRVHCTHYNARSLTTECPSSHWPTTRTQAHARARARTHTYTHVYWNGLRGLGVGMHQMHLVLMLC